MDKKTRYNVEKFYYDNYRVNKDRTERALNIYENNFGKLEGGRQHDPIYNDENVGRQIYTFGCQNIIRSLYTRIKTTNIYHYGSTLF